MRIAAAFLCIALTGCISPGRADSTYTVREVIEQRVELEGQRINVIGSLSHCQALSCGLSQGEFYLSIGSSSEFDEAATGFAGDEVVVAAKFTGECVSDPSSGILAVCADRSNTLSQPKLLGLARFFRS